MYICILESNETGALASDGHGLCAWQVYEELRVLGVGKVLGSLRISNMVAFGFFSDESSLDTYMENLR